MDARQIIIAPVVSEKSFAGADAGKYTFVVHARATKPMIRTAVEQIWGVHVRKVNTLHRRGKSVRQRRTFAKGYRPDTYRAVVTLAPGERIEIFEGA